MASFPSQEYRLLNKKLRLGKIGPDVYPQDPKQKEVFSLDAYIYISQSLRYAL